MNVQDWKVDGDCLLRHGKHAFLSGVNYLPSKHWLTILRNWVINGFGVNVNLLTIAIELHSRMVFTASGVWKTS